MNRSPVDRIRFENISLCSDEGVPLFEDLSFSLPMNKVVCLHGALGSGKSMFLKLLCGLLEPTEGKIFYNDVCINELGFEGFLPYSLNIGYSFEFGGLLSNKTVKQNLILQLEYHRQFMDFDIQERCQEILEDLGLEAYKDQRPSVIPGSIRKLTIVARALMLHPQLLILDEPTVGLKDEAVTRLKVYIQKQLRRGTIQSVIMCGENRIFNHGFCTMDLFIDSKKIVFLNNSEKEEKVRKIKV